VFESADPAEREVNATDKRFFWIALYAQPVLWILLAVVALVSFEFIWLTLVGEFYTIRIRTRTAESWEFWPNLHL
jgi:hypothetical protein